jgi:hypothetical protein
MEMMPMAAMADEAPGNNAKRIPMPPPPPAQNMPDITPPTEPVDQNILNITESNVWLGSRLYAH